jgi:hypothetical protein
MKNSFEQAPTENVFENMSIEAVEAWAEKIAETIGSENTEGKIGMECRPALERLQEALRLHSLAEEDEQKAETEKAVKETADELYMELKGSGEATAEALASSIP